MKVYKSGKAVLIVTCALLEYKMMHHIIGTIEVVYQKSLEMGCILDRQGQSEQIKVE